MLSNQQIADYERDGFLVLRGQLPESDISRLEQGFERHPPTDGSLGDARDLAYPEPGRYTLAHNCAKDPDLGFIAEHPDVTGPAADLLGPDPKLTAFVVYDRTPGGPGIGSHNDYKRWRPVGSSMNWLFTIVPFCDYDDRAGQLFVSPGSHRLDRVTEGPERPLEVAAAVRPPDDSFIDPELRRGDLLLMNMHTWHRAAPNTSDHHRAGIFNKYAAADAPPATGYYLFDDDVFAALSPEGQSVIAVHSDRSIDTTRVVLTRERGDTREVLLVRSDGRWELPGGPTFVEQAIPDWDIGNYIASLQAALRESLRIETPWVSYVGDYDEGDHLCRVYGYDLTGLGFPVAYDGEWVDADKLADRTPDLRWGYERTAVSDWHAPGILRGKGLAQAQSRVNQYAY